jgi:hypothetical protein
LLPGVAAVLVLGVLFALVLLFAVATLVILLGVITALKADGGHRGLLVGAPRDAASSAYTRRGELSW